MIREKAYDKVLAIGIDMQNDFCPGGSLGVEEGDKAVEAFNIVSGWVRDRGGKVIFTRDWHPRETSHFGFPPDFVKTWPIHCVQDTLGAAFSLDLDVRSTDTIISKGTEPDRDDYSGFQGQADDGTKLEGIIRPSLYESVALFIGGLATDYCVKTTVLDALKVAEGYEGQISVFAVTDAMRGVSEEGSMLAIEEMEKAGATLFTTRQLTEEALNVR